MVDLFTEWLEKRDSSKWVKRALTDTSYKKYYEKVYKQKCKEETNEDLATYGDAVIKLAYSELMLDKVKQLTVEKSKVESDEFLVSIIAKHYEILKFIKKDDVLPESYNYNDNRYQSKNHNKLKYIATVVEAMIGAIYKETNDLKKIVELLDKWKIIKILRKKRILIESKRKILL